MAQEAVEEERRRDGKRKKQKREEKGAGLVGGVGGGEGILQAEAEAGPGEGEKEEKTRVCLTTLLTSTWLPWSLSLPTPVDRGGQTTRHLPGRDSRLDTRRLTPVATATAPLRCRLEDQLLRGKRLGDGGRWW